MKTIRVTYNPPTASGRRVGWGKIVTNVDKTKTDGYAFEGEFMPKERQFDAPIGAVIIQKEPMGSVKNGYWLWNMGEITEYGLLWNSTYEPNEFLDFRDTVAESVDYFKSLKDKTDHQIDLKISIRPHPLNSPQNIAVGPQQIRIGREGQWKDALAYTHALQILNDHIDKIVLDARNKLPNPQENPE